MLHCPDLLKIGRSKGYHDWLQKIDMAAWPRGTLSILYGKLKIECTMTVPDQRKILIGFHSRERSAKFYPCLLLIW